MSLDDRQKAFIGYLLSLGREGQENRGALAELRSGLGRKPAEMARVHKHVVPYLPESKWDDHWYYLTATLFGMHPKHKNPVKREANGKKWTEIWTMGRAFRPLKKKSDSMEARFVALLNADAEDLDGHLRHAISLLKANEHPLDWFQLFRDVLQWDHPNGDVQLQWARDFYKGDSSNKTFLPDQTTNKEV